MLALTSTLTTRRARPALAGASRRKVLSVSVASYSSSSSPPPPPPPLPRPLPDDRNDEKESAAEQLQQTAKQLHPALVSIINSGFIESRRRLRQELAEDAWRGEPVGGGGGGDGGGGGSGSPTPTPLPPRPPPPPPPLPHTSPASWAARRGVARFERFLAGGGGGDVGGGEPPVFPNEERSCDGKEEAEALERALEGLYTALDSPLPPSHPALQQQQGAGQEEAAAGESAAIDSTAATLRALDRACAQLPTARHRLLARAFLEESLSEALREEYRRAADESRQMADLWGGGGGGGGGGAGGGAAAAARAAWGALKRLLPSFGWLGWLLPGGGGDRKGKGGGGGGGGKE